MDVIEATGRAGAASGHAPDRRRSTWVWRAVSTAAVLALLVLLVGEVTGSRSHGGHDSHAEPAAGNELLLAELRNEVAAAGLGPALGRLTALAAADVAVLRHAHHYVHELGRAGRARHGTADAFARCDGSFHSGCYHGVVQAHFEAQTSVERSTLASFCRGGVIDARTLSLEAQCVHGVGHGLGAFFARDVRAALDHCDVLPADEWRHRCYGGVFMQRVDTSAPPVDLCAGLDARHLTSCHFHQSVAVFRAQGRDVGAAFAACDEEDPPHAVACYEGMGRVVASFASFDPEQTLGLCRHGAPRYQPYCVRGAAQFLVGVFGDSGPALRLCAQAPLAARRGCFELAGAGVAVLHADPARRTVACARSSAEWVAVCRDAAGLSTEPEGSP